MVEALVTEASAELNEVVSFQPTQVFKEIVLFAIPQAATGVLRIHVDGRHANGDTLSGNAQSGVHPIRLQKAALRSRERGGMQCAPLPPLAHPGQSQLAGQVGGDLSS